MCWGCLASYSSVDSSSRSECHVETFTVAKRNAARAIFVCGWEIVCTIYTNTHIETSIGVPSAQRKQDSWRPKSEQWTTMLYMVAEWLPWCMMAGDDGDGVDRTISTRTHSQALNPHVHWCAVGHSSPFAGSFVRTKWTTFVRLRWSFAEHRHKTPCLCWCLLVMGIRVCFCQRLAHKHNECSNDWLSEFEEERD